ncbi:hypothetical protein DBR06_SOUSAS12410019, partial [Sousa chinensis]
RFSAWRCAGALSPYSPAEVAVGGG